MCLGNDLIVRLAWILVRLQLGVIIWKCACPRLSVIFLLGNSKVVPSMSYVLGMYYSFVGCTLDRKMPKGKWSMEVKGTNPRTCALKFHNA